MNFDIRKEQLRFYAAGTALIPVLPFLYLQGHYTRRKVGRLPDAEGETRGRFGDQEDSISLLTIGESTVAGVGAKDHDEALSGRLAKHISERVERSVDWYAVGQSGIKIHEALQILVPEIPKKEFDVIVVALGGNDVFGLSSPKKWRDGVAEMIRILRERNQDADIFLANVPMVRDFLAMPDPLRYVLSKLAKSHHFNTAALLKELEDVYYFYHPEKVEKEFFSDGIHPSAYGYDQWAEAMVVSYLNQTKRF